MTLFDLQKRVITEMSAKDVDVQWFGTDLYLRKNEVSKAIVADYDYKWMVSQFVDAIDHEVWYEVPFAKFPLEMMVKEG